MAIHEWIVMYGHVLTLKEFFQIMTKKSLAQFKRETEIDNLLKRRYGFAETQELRKWYHEYMLENATNILPRGLRIIDVSDYQCARSKLPYPCLAIGLIFATYDRDEFCPLYPLETLQPSSDRIAEYENRIQTVTHSELAQRLAAPAKVLLLIDECECC